jgi:hypothetical protein
MKTCPILTACIVAALALGMGFDSLAGPISKSNIKATLKKSALPRHRDVPRATAAGRTAQPARRARHAVPSRPSRR